jgi:hypothetical protein
VGGQSESCRRWTQPFARRSHAALPAAHLISVLLALGEDVPYVMRQVGHSDPKVTLSIYAQVMFRGEGEAERLKALVEGSNWANNGTSAVIRPPRVILKLLSRIKNPRLAGTSRMGTAGFEPATSRV